MSDEPMDWARRCADGLDLIGKWFDEQAEMEPDHRTTLRNELHAGAAIVRSLRVEVIDLRAQCDRLQREVRDGR